MVRAKIFILDKFTFPHVIRKLLLTCGDVNLSRMKIFALTILFSFIKKMRFPKNKPTTTKKGDYSKKAKAQNNRIKSNQYLVAIHAFSFVTSSTEKVQFCRTKDYTLLLFFLHLG